MRASAGRGDYAATVIGMALLGACSTSTPKYSPESFDSATTHSRGYGAAPPHTCEAARRALLSQGFVITVADANRVDGRKNFQPQPELHVEIEFHVVCVPDGKVGEKTIAFATALQDRYALKKSSNSASVGVGPIGSLSLPFSSSDDSLVRVGSETINSTSFYDGYFVLLKRYLDADADRQAPDPKPVAAPVLAPVLAPTAPPALPPATEPAASAPPAS